MQQSNVLLFLCIVNIYLTFECNLAKISSFYLFQHQQNTKRIIEDGPKCHRQQAQRFLPPSAAPKAFENCFSTSLAAAWAAAWAAALWALVTAELTADPTAAWAFPAILLSSRKSRVNILGFWNFDHLSTTAGSKGEEKKNKG